MKQTITTIALIAVAAALFGAILMMVGSTTAERREQEYSTRAAAAAEAKEAAQLDPTQEYRLWLAEGMINHLADKFRITESVACTNRRTASPEMCGAVMRNNANIVKNIREVAISGNDAQWTAVIGKVDQLGKASFGSYYNGDYWK